MTAMTRDHGDLGDFQESFPDGWPTRCETLTLWLTEEHTALPWIGRILQMESERITIISALISATIPAVASIVGAYITRDGSRKPTEKKIPAAQSATNPDVAISARAYQLMQGVQWLRSTVGVIGFSLPFVLVVGKTLLQGGGLERSISAYYYTDMRNVFVVTLSAVGILIFAYRGYDRMDRIAAQLACLGAIGAALVPTTPSIAATFQEAMLARLHYVFFLLFFLTLAYFSIFLFTKTGPGMHPTPEKLKRNTVHRLCGYTILACTVLIILPQPRILLVDLRPVFWLESTALIAFGFSWLTKGGFVLKDLLASRARR